eukprot:4464202-Pleurochrysis_carterae.AAC.1
MREANLWRVGPPAYFEDGNYIRVTNIEVQLQDALRVNTDVPAVWACKSDSDRRSQPSITRELNVCYHPSARLPSSIEERAQSGAKLGDRDPAIPHIRTQQRLRAVLRNAFALGRATGRAVILPHFWCVCALTYESKDTQYVQRAPVDGIRLFFMVISTLTYC